MTELRLVTIGIIALVVLVAVALLLVALVLRRTRALEARLDAIDTQLEAIAAIDPIWSAESVKHLLERVGRSPKGIEQHVRLTTARDVSALLALRDLLPVRTEVPSPGGWAATPQTILALVALVERLPANSTIVECGSGTSTVWLGLAIQARAAGIRLVSLEHDESYAASTRAALERNGVTDAVEVRVAPLTEQDVDGQEYSWYAPSALDGLGAVSLVFVDGPPGKSAHDARYPAYPLLRGTLLDGARVVLDDTDRADEQEVLARWLEANAAAGHLSRERGLDRAVVLLFDAAPS